MSRPRRVGDRGLAIAMVSDFFYPQPGGVESHIYQLSQRLIDRGHKVIVVTHAYNDRVGVRYLTNGLKVYYVPFLVIYREATFPSVFSFFPIFRNIMLREGIEVVHGHASLSSLCHEAILHARTMGLRTCFTDHSLFGFADAGSMLTNKLLKFTLSDIDHVICVSHTCKENTVLRAALDPAMVSVIPNAVVSEDFSPTPTPPPLSEGVIIVVICRLFYNKGADLLVACIPRICELHPHVKFIVAGDGPKMIDLIQMREKCMLQDRVEMLGTVRHEQVRDIMVRGHIYLHPSLTEAFGTVIVEAASCGLYVVCTRVGGVPEVLPSHMTTFARPEADDLVAATSRAIAALLAGRVRTDKFHDQVRRMYSWTDIAARTERVYRHIASRHCAPLPLAERLKRYYGCGVLAGKLFCFVVAIDYLLLLFLELCFPKSAIDTCRTLTKARLARVQDAERERQIADSASYTNGIAEVDEDEEGHDDGGLAAYATVPAISVTGAPSPIIGTELTVPSRANGHLGTRLRSDSLTPTPSGPSMAASATTSGSGGQAVRFAESTASEPMTTTSSQSSLTLTGPNGEQDADITPPRRVRGLQVDGDQPVAVSAPIQPAQPAQLQPVQLQHAASAQRDASTLPDPPSSSAAPSAPADGSTLGALHLSLDAARDYRVSHAESSTSSAVSMTPSPTPRAAIASLVSAGVVRGVPLASTGAEQATPTTNRTIDTNADDANSTAARASSAARSSTAEDRSGLPRPSVDDDEDRLPLHPDTPTGASLSIGGGGGGGGGGGIGSSVGAGSSSGGAGTAGSTAQSSGGIANALAVGGGWITRHRRRRDRDRDRERDRERDRDRDR